MSRFVDYNFPGLARKYDTLRMPQGVDVIAGLLPVYCRKPFQNIHLLDAGCGTGQHAEFLLEMGIGDITLLDASQEMLQIAKEKLDKAINTNTAHIVQAMLPDLPFQGNDFDAVMFNNTLHHLDDVRDGKNYPKLEQTLQETKRILKKDGMLIITTGLPQNVRESLWYLQLLPRVREIIANQLLSFDQYMSFFDKYGYECVTALNLLTTKGQSFCSNHFDADNLLDKDWRQANNMFRIATDTEIQEMEAAIIAMKEKGTIEQFVKDNDFTQERGLVTMFACISKKI